MQGKSAPPPGLGRCQQRGDKGETSIIPHRQGVLLLFLRHLYQDTDMAILLMAEEKEDPNENPPTPLELGRYQQCGDKVETAVILFIVFAVGICLNRQGLRWGIKHGLYICFVPGPCLCSLVRSIFLLS